MDLTYKQEVQVGALVLVGVAVFLGLMFWLTGRAVGGEGVTVRVVFQNAMGLEGGDPVLVSGVKKGRVSGLRLEEVGRVTVVLELASDVRPRIDAVASIASQDFFGNKYIEYFPGTSERFLEDGTTITGTAKAEFADMASEFLGGARALVSEQLVVDLHNTLVATQRTLGVLAEAGQGPLVAQTTATLASVERVMTRVDSILVRTAGAQRVDSLSRNLNELTDNLAKATGSLDTLLGRMSRGEGTLGRMATDTLLYNNLNATLQALTALLTDLRERPGRYLTVKVF